MTGRYQAHDVQFAPGEFRVFSHAATMPAAASTPLKRPRAAGDSGMRGLTGPHRRPYYGKIFHVREDFLCYHVEKLPQQEKLP
jgi:hypothetical protein